ncbi:hypothetical protein [Bifidobacterium adolescentis]|uniref:hypothetical protein n=1 Tax=Bifidobacterium adolescentis TaxID=1680 RepID=UPI0034A19FDF
MFLASFGGWDPLLDAFFVQYDQVMLFVEPRVCLGFVFGFELFSDFLAFIQWVHVPCDVCDDVSIVVFSFDDRAPPPWFMLCSPCGVFHRRTSFGYIWNCTFVFSGVVFSAMFTLFTDVL